MSTNKTHHSCTRNQFKWRLERYKIYKFDFVTYETWIRKDIVFPQHPRSYSFVTSHPSPVLLLRFGTDPPRPNSGKLWVPSLRLGWAYREDPGKGTGPSPGSRLEVLRSFFSVVFQVRPSLTGLGYRGRKRRTRLSPVGGVTGMKGGRS